MTANEFEGCILTSSNMPLKNIGMEKEKRHCKKITVRWRTGRVQFY